MTNLLLFVALATLIVLIIILAITFKEKNVLKEDLKDLQETSESNIQQLEGAFESLQKQIEVLQSELDSLNARHTE